MPTDPETQLAHFREAVDLLGGTRATARILDVHERTVLRLAAGTATLHDGFLRDIAAALADHGRKCYEAERRLTPLFAANLIENQPRESRRRTRFQETTFKDLWVDSDDKGLDHKRTAD